MKTSSGVMAHKVITLLNLASRTLRSGSRPPAAAAVALLDSFSRPVKYWVQMSFCLYFFLPPSRSPRRSPRQEVRSYHGGRHEEVPRQQRSQAQNEERQPHRPEPAEPGQPSKPVRLV